MTLGVGIHLDIPNADYHADPCERPSLSSSIAKILVTRTPLHAWEAHPRLGNIAERKGTDATDRGEVIHGLVLGGGRDFVVVQADDWKTKAAREKRDEARAAGMVPLLEHVFIECSKAAEVIGRLIPKNIAREVTVVWESDGVLCRGRLDGWDGERSIILDLKNCDDANASGSGTNHVRMGYDIQDAAYTEAMETVAPERAGRIVFQRIFAEVSGARVEKCKIVESSGSMLELGRQRWARAKRTWAACIAANNWPGYPTEAVRVEAPAWSLAAELDAMAEMDMQHDGDAF